MADGKDKGELKTDACQAGGKMSIAWKGFRRGGLVKLGRRRSSPCIPRHVLFYPAVCPKSRDIHTNTSLLNTPHDLST